MRVLLVCLICTACGDDSGGQPAAKPVLGTGSFAGSFHSDDGVVNGLIGVIASSDGRVSIHVARLDDYATFFESNTAGKLLQGTSQFQPLSALAGQGLLTDAKVTVTAGQLSATVTTHPQGMPPDRTIMLDGMLGTSGGAGTFTAMTSAGTTHGTWMLAPGVSPDAGRPPPPDAPVDAPEDLDAGVD